MTNSTKSTSERKVNEQFQKAKDDFEKAKDDFEKANEKAKALGMPLNVDLDSFLKSFQPPEAATPKPKSKPKAKKAKGKKTPPKPNKNFPMFAHGSGMWAKKILGKLVYFTSWKQDPKGIEAQKQFDRDWPYLRDGKIPPSFDVGDGLTIRALCNDFLATKEDKVNAGELAHTSFIDYFQTCERLVHHFGRDRKVSDLRHDDFRSLRASMAKRLGVVSLKNEVNRIRIVFNYAWKNELIDKPVSYGTAFDRPTAKALRKNRNESGPKLFERVEVLAILDAADLQIRAMTLLGLHGLGNTDIANLQQSHLDLESGWLDYPRGKTEIGRRIPLMPEAVRAIKVWLPHRPKAADPADDGCVFLTNRGQRWVRLRERPDKLPLPLDALTQAFGKLLRKLGINGRVRLGFYCLRHCTETYGGECRDQVAVDAVMGHVPAASDMSANYRHRISDERLKAVVETVRTWLFGQEGGAE